jgi:hypothetical protein
MRSDEFTKEEIIGYVSFDTLNDRVDIIEKSKYGYS